MFIFIMSISPYSQITQAATEISSYVRAVSRYPTDQSVGYTAARAVIKNITKKYDQIGTNNRIIITDAMKLNWKKSNMK